MAGELLLEERLARGDLVGLGVAVARRAALEDVADVDVVAAEAHRFDHLGQELAGGADERLAGAILVGARRLADEDQRRVGVADAEDDVGALGRELAALAVAKLFADDSEAGRTGVVEGGADLEAADAARPPVRVRRVACWCRTRRCPPAGRRSSGALCASFGRPDDAAALEPGDVLLDLPRERQQLVAIAHCAPPPPRPARAASARDRGCDRRPRPCRGAAGARRCRRAPTARRGWSRCRSPSPPRSRRWRR